MEGDEAHYALCVDHILDSGQWLTLSPHPPTPYFAKPPLYMWLTAATYRWLPGFEFKYRFWSAMFAVGSVAMTFLLGTAMFSEQAGLIGAGLLLTNRQFLLEHGARAGDMDTAVTFCVLLACAAYWRAIGNAKQRGGWIWLGLAAGAACLFKPAGGAMALLLLGIHAGLFSGLHRRRWVGGLCLSLAICALVAAPWYLVQWWRFHGIFLQVVIGETEGTVLTGRPGETKPPLFYLAAITLSSWAFYLAIPATGFALIRGDWIEARWPAIFNGWRSDRRVGVGVVRQSREIRALCVSRFPDDFAGNCCSRVGRHGASGFKTCSQAGKNKCALYQFMCHSDNCGHSIHRVGDAGSA